MPEGWLLGRVAGDEFVVVAPGDPAVATLGPPPYRYRPAWGAAKDVWVTPSAQSAAATTQPAGPVPSPGVPG